MRHKKAPSSSSSFPLTPIFPSPTMEATRFSPNHFYPHRFQTKPNALRERRYVKCINGIGARVSLFTNPAFNASNRSLFPKLNRTLSVSFSDRLRGDYARVDEEVVPATRGDGGEAVISSSSPSANSSGTLQLKPLMFRNRFLNFARLGSVINGAAESFFKSEIRRRLFVTAMLIVISRVGYFIPLPGFDRRLIPEDYLSFVAGSSVDELGDFTAELKLSIFQLGISPQIIASIIMQVLCHVVPSLVKLRKEGLDGHEKIKSYIWWMSFGFAILEALIVACYSLPYSIYAATYRVKHVMVTSILLVCGAMTITWICDTISESGFGQGSSLIICVGILTGYMETLYKMLTQLSAAAEICTGNSRVTDVLCNIKTSKNIAIDLNLRTETMAKANSEPKIDYAEIYTASDTFDCSAVFHTIYDVVGFVLYMHQQIPSTVQDMSVEFDAMHSEYKQLEMELGTEVKPSFRRKHVSKMRDIKVGIKRLDKLMNSLLNVQTAFKIMISEIPTIDDVVLALGASPLRPQHIYVLNFSHESGVSKVDDDFARSKAADTLSRKAIRTLISKDAGSVTYPGPIKLFVLIKAPSSFNQPMHFLPKRDFRYNRKVSMSTCDKRPCNEPDARRMKSSVSN
ncbi:Preprotein translocase subunit SCY2, chloroplastic [Glycine soja]